MKKIPPSLEDKLLRYLDGELSAADRSALESDVARDEALRERLDLLLELNLGMKAAKMEHPSRNFTQQVMNKLDQYPRRAATFSIRGGILLLAGVLIATAIAAILVSAGVFDQATTMVDLNIVELPKKYFQMTLPSIPFNGKLMVNFIILLNLGLAWLVLDRVILKPFFQRRMYGPGQ